MTIRGRRNAGSPGTYSLNAACTFLDLNQRMKIIFLSQPNPFSNTGETKVVERSSITVSEGEDNKLTVMNEGVSLQELVNALNSLGVSPRDMITILQNIKAAGALQAELEVK